MRAIGRFLGWFVVVSVPVGLYGEAIVPLLLILAADVVVGHLILRTLSENRAVAAG